VAVFLNPSAVLEVASNKLAVGFKTNPVMPYTVPFKNPPIPSFFAPLKGFKNKSIFFFFF